MKTCTKCKELKSFDEFHKSKYNPTGYVSHCKVCLKKNRQTEEYKEQSRKQAAKFKQSEKGKEYTKRYEASEKNKERKRAWKKTEAGKASQKRYQQTEEYKKSQKEYRRRNPQWHTYSDKKYRSNPENQDKIRARRTVWYATKTGKIPKPATLECVDCGDKAAGYHHHNGYSREHWLDVIPVCRTCHESRHQVKPPLLS